jgi:hypothetical protein
MDYQFGNYKGGFGKNPNQFFIIDHSTFAF